MSDDLETLSTDELRSRAFDKAGHDHDAGFVWSVARHLRGARAIAAEDGSAGAITGSITEAVQIVQELRGKEPLGEDEPLLRAKFLDYLRS